MSMKINKISIPLHNRKGCVPLFKPDVAESLHTQNYHADNVMKSSHFSFWNKLLFNFVDTVYPTMINHSKFGKYFVRIVEKTLADSSEIQRSFFDTKI